MSKKSEFWQNGIKSHKECKKLAFAHVESTFDKLVKSSLDGNLDFAYEGHFTNDATWDIPKRFKEQGYEIHLIFFGLTDTALSETRVVSRAQEGGHYVDPVTIADNFYGNLEKMDKYFSIFDTVTIVDTSSVVHLTLAVLKNGECDSAVRIGDLPFWFLENLQNISNLINTSNKDI